MKKVVMRKHRIAWPEIHLLIRNIDTYPLIPWPIFPYTPSGSVQLSFGLFRGQLF